MTEARASGAGATTIDTLARILSRTVRPLLRTRPEPDTAFLDPGRRSHPDAMATLSENHWDRLIGEYGLTGRGAILDIACGSGDWLAALAKTNPEVTGVDMDAEMLRLARQRSSGAENVEIRSMSAESLDFPGDAFDAVTCFTSLPYFDQHLAIGEMARVLKPGGHLVVGTVGPGYYAKHVAEGIRHDEPNAVRYGLDALLVAAGRAVRGGAFAPASLQAWSPHAVGKLLAHHGFVVDRVVRDTDPIDPNWPNEFLGRPLYFTVFATKRHDC
jgi:SAM-dependent methyltransferase